MMTKDKRTAKKFSTTVLKQALRKNRLLERERRMLVGASSSRVGFHALTRS
jgi:hypothetical protein